MNDKEYSIELNDIKMFVNLSPAHKRLWIEDFPNRTLCMLEYLINITKDR